VVVHRHEFCEERGGVKVLVNHRTSPRIVGGRRGVDSPGKVEAVIHWRSGTHGLWARTRELTDETRVADHAMLLMLLLLYELSLLDVVREFSRRHTVSSLRVSLQLCGSKLGLSESRSGEGEGSSGLRGEEGRDRGSLSRLEGRSWGVGRIRGGGFGTDGDAAQRRTKIINRLETLSLRIESFGYLLIQIFLLSSRLCGFRVDDLN